MLKRYLKLQLFLLLVLFSQPLIADEEQFMNFDDFLFDIKDYINKSIKVQVPVYAVDIPSRLAQVDGNVAVDLEQIDRQKIKDIIIKMIEILQLPKMDNKKILNAATSIKYNQINAIN